MDNRLKSKLLVFELSQPQPPHKKLSPEQSIREKRSMLIRQKIAADALRLPSHETSHHYAAKPYEIVDRTQFDEVAFMPPTPKLTLNYFENPEIMNKYINHLESAKLEQLNYEIPQKHVLSRRETWRYHPGQKLSYRSMKSGLNPHANSRASNKTNHHNVSSLLQDEPLESEPTVDPLQRSMDQSVLGPIWKVNPTVLDTAVSSSSKSSRKRLAKVMSRSVDYTSDALDVFTIEPQSVMKPDHIQDSNVQTELRSLSHKQQRDYKVFKQRIEGSKSSIPRQRTNIYQKKIETRSFLTPEEKVWMTGKGKVSDLMSHAKVQLSRCREFNLPLPKNLFETAPRKSKAMSKPAISSSQPLEEIAEATHSNLNYLRMMAGNYEKGKQRRSYYLHKVVEEADYVRDNPLWDNVKKQKLDKDYRLYSLLRNKLYPSPD